MFVFETLGSISFSNGRNSPPFLVNTMNLAVHPASFARFSSRLWYSTSAPNSASVSDQSSLGRSPLDGIARSSYASPKRRFLFFVFLGLTVITVFYALVSAIIFFRSPKKCFQFHFHRDVLCNTKCNYSSMLIGLPIAILYFLARKSSIRSDLLEHIKLCAELSL